MIENTKHSVVFAMTDQKRAVAFVFGYVRKQPRSNAEFDAEPRVALQRRQVQHWAKSNGHALVTTLGQTTTYRGTAFALSPKFREAVHMADELKCDLVVADIQEMLNRTASDKIRDTVLALDGVQPEIWDTKRNATWRSLSATARLGLMLHAKAVQSSRSNTVKLGQKLRSAHKSRASKKSPPAGNGKRGNLANKKKADATARRLAEFVKLENSKLVPGVRLSPSALAKALNEAGIPTERSGAWSHNGAKNLIRRLQKLGLL